MPSLQRLDKDKLLDFLGPDFNTQLSATTEPVTSAPRACDLLATVVGSGGEFMCMSSHFYFFFFNFYERNCIPCGKKRVTGVQAVTASEVQIIICLTYANEWESMGKPCSCTQFIKSRIFYYKFMCAASERAMKLKVRMIKSLSP